jgi:twitching motility two-component system response regulator PilH
MEKRVLVVDDEEEVRDFVSAVLEENGYSPLTAENGLEALEAVERDRPDLIIMDILMPMQGGIKLYRALKLHETFKDIPVAIYSGIAKRTFLRTQAFRDEMGKHHVPEPEAYIEKPAKVEQLESAINKILNPGP